MDNKSEGSNGTSPSKSNCASHDGDKLLKINVYRFLFDNWEKKRRNQRHLLETLPRVEAPCGGACVSAEGVESRATGTKKAFIKKAWVLEAIDCFRFGGWDC